MSRVEERWQQTLERLRAGLKASGLAPMPRSVERSLEHAYVAGMVAHRALVLSALDDAVGEGLNSPVEALHDLDDDLMAAAERLGVSAEDTRRRPRH